MKNFDIEDPITKLNQVSTKRGEVLIANKISTLKDIWYGHEINKVRKLHVEKKIEEVTICKKCPFKDTYDWKQIN